MLAVYLVGCGDDATSSGATDPATTSTGSTSGSASTTTGTTGDSEATTSAQTESTGTQGSSGGTETDAPSTGTDGTGTDSTGATDSSSGDTAGTTTGELLPCSDEQIAECDPSATCAVDEEGMPICTCLDGFQGPGDFCADIDECAEELDDCDADATCTNAAGSFDCACNEYFYGNGTFCLPIDAETHVLDVSASPIRIVTSLGDFRVNAMGRIAVEVMFDSTPGKGNAVERTVTGWQVHDVVMRNVEAEPGSDLQDLIDWEVSQELEIALVVLEGPTTEELTFALQHAWPVSIDSTIEDDQLAEIVLASGDFYVESYVAPTESLVFGPTTQLEVEGLSGYFEFSAEDITEAPPDSADLIEVRKIRNDAADGSIEPLELMTFFENFLDLFDQDGIAETRNLSQIHRTGAGTELDRVTCTEAFFNLVYFFNPAKHYGTSPLLDATLATEYCAPG